MRTGNAKNWVMHEYWVMQKFQCNAQNQGNACTHTRTQSNGQSQFLL